MKNFFFLVLALVSLQALAQRTETGRDSKTIAVTENSRDFNLNFRVPVYRYDYRTQVVPSTCYRTECDSSPGNGSQGDWKGFFNVPKEQKASALASAIKGIGKSTAEKIVNNNLLTHKPDNWNLFVSEMNKIEKRLNGLGYQSTFAREVVEVYGYENRINLGYGSAESCRKEPYTCYITQTVEVQTRLTDISRQLRVSINNQVLQSFEQDDVTITVGNDNNDVLVSSNGNNNYVGTIFNRGSALELNATRVKRAFPVKEVSVTAYRTDKQLTVISAVPQKFFTEDVGAAFRMDIEICKAGFLNIGCKSLGIFPVENAGANVTKSFNITTTGNIFARVRYTKIGSQYYGSTPSEFVTTNKIKF
jgi:ribosomal protein S13